MVDNRVLRSASALLRLGRAEVAVVGAFPYGMGILMAPHPTPLRFVSFYAFGMLTHCVGCAVNDIADARTDRLNPMRADAPLVRGDCSRTAGTVFSFALSICAVILAAWISEGSIAIFLSLAGLLAVGVYGNAYQKRFGGPHAFFVDLLFGVFIGTPVVLGVVICGGRPTAPLLLFVACLVAQGPVLNAMRGNLKDLHHDTVVRAHTVAIALGAGQAEHRGDIRTTLAFRRYCAVIFGAATALLVATVCSAPISAEHSTFHHILIAGAVGPIILATAGLSIVLRRNPVAPRMFIHRVLFPMNIATLVTAGVICPRWEILGICVATYAWSVFFAAIARWLAQTRRTGIPPVTAEPSSAH